MTKYIDLLREHQKKPNQKKTSKKKKNVDATNSVKHNPYSTPKDDKDNLIENMDALLEEQDNAMGNQNESSNPLIGNAGMLLEEPEELVGNLHISGQANQAIQNNDSKTENEIETIPTLSQIDMTSGEFDASAWLLHISQTLTFLFASIEQNEKINLRNLEDPLNMMFDHLQSSPKIIDRLDFEINKRPQDAVDTLHNADLVQKSMMLMLYSIKVGSQLKLQAKELVPSAVAAMLHHLGMALVAPAIRQKSDILNDDELLQIKEAPQKALHYLQHQQIQHEQLLLAITQASERYDGSGPHAISGQSIAWIARLLSLLSMFEALIHFRPYRQRLLPRDAIRDIVKNHKKEFDPEMLKALIESISLYPVGTYIQLNTAEIGQVTNIHAKFPLRPVVLINMDKYGHAITERKIDLKTQPNLMIQKCMYEEGLKALIEGQNQ
ncbi:MAG: hypothetical protein R8M14_01825 [Ghiorsea sp.]